MKVLFSAMLLLVGAFGYSQEYQFVGNHYIASFHGCERRALCDTAQLKEVMLKAAEASGATVLGAKDFIFLPDGLTMVLLLSESHASIHTYPEHDACFIDLFTCGNSCKAEKFAEVLSNYLHPARIDDQMLLRE